MRETCWFWRNCDSVNYAISATCLRSPVEQQNVSSSQFAELFPAAGIESSLAHCFSQHVVNATPLVASATFTEAALGLYTAGRHRVRRKQGGGLVEGWSDPGSVNL